MKEILVKAFNGRIISPWWILAIDTVLVANAFIVAYVLRLNFSLPAYTVWEFLYGSAFATIVYVIVFFIFGVHKGVIRHTNFSELRVLLFSCLIAFSILLGFDIVLKFFDWREQSVVPRLVLVLHFMLVAILCFGFRLVVRETYTYLTQRKGTINAVIYGAGDLGLITLEAIKNDKDNQYQVVGFVDDEPSKWNMNLHTLPVLSWEMLLEDTGKFKDVEEIILALANVTVKHKQTIADECLKRDWKLKVMPSVGNWVNGISNRDQIRDVRIEDLLGRDEIQLNQKKILLGLENKTILVSGAAGSIGSEIVRQLLRFPIKKIILLDQAESALYDLQQEILLRHYDAPFNVVLADVTNKIRMANVFKEYQPHIVFNAAAYKHVPLMEDAPYEAIRVNVGGTKILADLSLEYGVEKFIMVSTDKAVNPTNVMGTSKRICEIYVQSLAQMPDIKTGFVTTRFGNVLGSNGSVVPLFKKQIAQGGPVTVTHPDITRFFMTIPEACQLVLEAAFMGHGGEIFVFDMGEPVKILDLAQKMIKLSGLKLGEDIDIKFTGLRPGEKLYEELLASKENTIPTYNDKIMIGNVIPYNFLETSKIITELLGSLYKESEESLIIRMKELVPEFYPQNPKYKNLFEDAEIRV
jgi:FlaA1/EpsC-like NDP-sugar epimerase